MQIIAWLAYQPWSNGSVGMMGISWSGFNSLQMAMRHATPKTQSRHRGRRHGRTLHDDVHYVDGMAHIDEFELNMDMAPGMTRRARLHARRKECLARFDVSAVVAALLSSISRDGLNSGEARCVHTTRSRFLCFLIGGLLDGYRDSVTDMLQQTEAPLKAIVGPWNHTFPHLTQRR